MKYLSAIAFLLLSLQVSKAQQVAVPDTIWTDSTKSEIKCFRHTLLLNDDTIPDYFEYQSGYNDILNWRPKFDFRFIDGATGKEIERGVLPDWESFDAFGYAIDCRKIPIGYRLVDIEVRIVDVDCSDAHNELLLQISQGSNKIDDHIYSTIIFRYDSLGACMKVIFDSWTEISLYNNQAPFVGPKYININHDNVTCIDTIFWEDANVIEEYLFNKPGTVFGRILQPIVGPKDLLKYFFDPHSNMFVEEKKR